MKHATTAGLLLLGQGFAGPVGAEQPAGIPRAVEIARATVIPACTDFVDAAAAAGGAGTSDDPHRTIAAAVEAAEPGAIICVAEGVYSEELTTGKPLTLAGGFQSGTGFSVRDSARYVSKAEGSGGGSFIRIEDPGPTGEQLTEIDGFEITGYSQAIYRDIYYSQRFDITNNYIHDNRCADQSLAGGGFALNNVSGAIRGNVFENNECGRGGAGFLNDDSNSNSVLIEGNRIDGNAGTEPESSHGGALYLFINDVTITGNSFTDNSVTQWGGGLYVGAYTQGGQFTTARLAWNVYRGNRAGDGGGGFFCDEGATCESDHEVYDGNCGANILLDAGWVGSEPTIARFDHLTSVNALAPGCQAPGAGVFIDTYEGLVADTYSFTNSIFWGNAEGGDFATACDSGCEKIKVSVTRSLVQQEYQDGNIAIDFGEGNIAPVDPHFVDAGAGDFRLRPDSPLAGSELGAYAGVEAEAAAEEEGAPAPAEENRAEEPVVAAGPAPDARPAAADPDAPPAPASDVSAKAAFDDAKELGTVEAWEAFLAYYPAGFYADLARAYLKELGAESPAAPATAETAGREQDAPEEAPAGPRAPAVARGGDYMGFSERFNRYYTDPAWEASRTLYVSPEGGGDGTSREAPTLPEAAIAAAEPGTAIHFMPGSYEGCFVLYAENSGTYDDPIVLYGERNDDQSLGVSMRCCTEGWQACVSLEDADYVAVDGFELLGGRFGVRAVGADYPASQHSRGIAVLNSVARDQEADSFFTGHADWAVLEGNTGSGARERDGHGIYLSNGGDWNIVRFNETFEGVSSDFQINADPHSTCKDVGVPYDDPRCDAYAGEGEGGQGASDYFLIDSNYFHHSLGPGANFTSVRRSVIRNNIFGPSARHNVSFWQETDNPRLGASDNQILHNLFITTGRHGIKFENHSTRNAFVNNVILGVEVEDGEVRANASALLMEVDGTADENVYRSNLYVAGTIEGRTPGDDEMVLEEFSAGWFENFPLAVGDDPDGLAPSGEAPFLAIGRLSDDAPFDRRGTRRPAQVDLGPFEVP